MVASSFPAPDLGNVKGAAIREFLVWYQSARGVDELQKLVERVPAPYSDQLDVGNPSLGILASSWYPADVIHAFLDAIVGDPETADVHRMLREGTHAMMEANLGSIYKRFFVRMILSPQRYVRYAQSLWNLHFDNGTLSAAMNGERAIHWRIDGWRSHHRALCQIVTYSEPAVFGAMGCSHITVEETSCVSLGDDFCSHDIRWR